MRQIAILPCGKRKIWDVEPQRGPTKVNEAYIGTLHRLTKEYAQAYCDDWVILSAKHGFRSKNEMIEQNYDLTFGMDQDQIISTKALRKQITTLQLDRYDRAVILTGQKHKRVIEALGGITDNDVYPLLGTKGIGEMQQRLRSAINEKQPLA
ncbi:hypothetical protein DES38_102243 [Streptohalobacillus salinus]|uniref:DUF6884 domain-containing protein n=1 Tax=Streptohalobacillus salinus TaxID=621096 RepID=A0A2V3WFX5_9BACI|nr:DUF6884 domain-containing protein [Streptohalobacillus salinus]PXW92659.1 hypothetical protein DES38_102243 [Streptohalobacillus salinus]